jgi:hypothetical protein
MVRRRRPFEAIEGDRARLDGVTYRQLDGGPIKPGIIAATHSVPTRAVPAKCVVCMSDNGRA